MGVLDDLTFQRDTLLAKIDRIDTVAKTVEANPQDKKSKLLLKAMSENIDQRYDDFHEVTTKLQVYYSKQNPRIETDLQPSILEFELSFYNIKAVLDTAFPTAAGPNISMNATAGATTASAGGGAAASLAIALPKLPLMEFNGDVRQWNQFRDLYECLNKGHYLKDCPKENPCKHCSGTHNSLLHFEKVKINQPAVIFEQESVNNTSVLEGAQKSFVAAGKAMLGSLASSSVVLLSTVKAEIRDFRGKYWPVKVLLDSASTESFITVSCAKRLGLKLKPATQVPVVGLAGTMLGAPKELVHCKFRTVQSVALELEALVVKTIAKISGIGIRQQKWDHLQGVTLADPGYDQAQAIDILLGAEWYPMVLTGKKIIGPPGTPSAIETIWGYCLMGRVNQSASEVHNLCISSEPSLDELIRRFWAVEEPPQASKMSTAEIECENHYRATVQRTTSGRFVVELPFMSNASSLGDSRQAALKRFLLLEQRLAKNCRLKDLYIKFMADYQQQGHMVIASDIPAGRGQRYYIPHHCIYRQKSGGDIEKFRVVFDASMKTKNGPSLNQVLHCGPSLQLDIVDILLKFRAHEVVLICDIKQMYGNIQVAESQQNYQRIFWRADPEEELQEFVLTTVTYGVSAAPYLAIRSLHQLVNAEGGEFSAASKAILSSTYMDDVVVSVKTLTEAKILQEELVELLGKAQFQLRKWLSNRPELLQSLPEEHCAIAKTAFSFCSELDKSTKILEFLWNPVGDYFFYQVQPVPQKATKRVILSTVARVYDPMGYLAPVTLVGKCLIQYLWQLGCDWNDAVPKEVEDKWQAIRDQLPELAELRLPRSLKVDSAVRLQLHGFADSSERGYAGVVYMRAEQPDGKIVVSIVVAKSKVAPLKSITLPRLELCAVVLVAKLLRHTYNIYSTECNVESMSAWSDSTVALSWLRSSPHRWTTFVANRVSQAQEYLAPEQFRHVPTNCNPADCASRGLSPNQLKEHQLWWRGPTWLSQPEKFWPKVVEENLELLRPTMDLESRKLTLMVQVGEETATEWMERYSSLSTLQRVTAYLLRFVRHCQDRKNRKLGHLSSAELSKALRSLIKMVQLQEFAQDREVLKMNKQCSKQLRKLNPFLDKEGLMRVGGRLSQSSISFDRKYPLLLPKSTHLTHLIIDYYHAIYLHPGLLNLHCILQNQFWILAGRDAIRRRVGQCLKCFKSRPISNQPLMGDLPVVRLQQVKAFSNCGVDYGGPFWISLGRVKNAKRYKAYICLFVCLSTRAIHLELASELSTDAFLAALRRFIARRGAVKNLYSDCGTNFVGARRVLNEWETLINNGKHNEAMQRYLADRGIEWHFNQPASPHFGGIWEAGIKATKKLLGRVIGEQVLTYEEFTTVLSQVESTLNSRPLTPMSSDPADLQALTPGHFLLMEAPSAIIEPELPEKIVNYRDRWRLLQQIFQSFWRRWSAEYLCTLQQRAKWNVTSRNLAVGDLVE